ncbi:hypothetical protein DMUE_1631, partial [Dictyocoela muelleri]
MDHNKIVEIKSKRGGKMILLNGYCYNIDRSTSNSSSWRCIDRKCRGRLYFLNNKITKSQKHNCDQNYEKNEALFMNYNTIKRALKTTERPRDILSREIGVISPATNLFLPNQKNHIDKLTKIRRKQNIIICE